MRVHLVRTAGSEIRPYLQSWTAGPVLIKNQALIVEIKGYRREDAKVKKSTMETYWVPGVNHLGSQARWAFAEFTEFYQIESDFRARVESEFNKMIEQMATR